MNKLSHIFLLILIGCCLQAQQDSVNVVPELPGDEVEVVKDFRARLAEAQMLRLLPQAPVVQTKDLKFDYLVELRKLELDYLPPVIRPMALPAEPDIQSKNALLSFGYGYPRLSEGRAMVDYELTEKLSVGLNYQHLASSHQEKLPSGFYRNEGGLQFTYDLGNGQAVQVGTDVGINKNEILTTDDEFRNDRFDNRYGFNLGIGKGIASKGNVTYNADFSYSNFRVNDLVLSSFTENNIGFDAGVGYSRNSFRVGTDMKILRSAANAESVDSYTAFFVDPYAVYAIGGWKLKGGATILVDGSTKFYPQVDAAYSVLGDLLVARAYAQSRFSLNNHENTYVYNPFIEILSDYTTAREMQFGGGVSGRNEKWSYGADIYYSIHEDLQAFSRDSISGSYTYEAKPQEATALNVTGNVSYAITEMVSINSSVLYRNLQDSTGADILGYYDVEWSIGSTISLLGNKLQIRPGADVLLMNAVGTESGDRSFVDLQLTADYEIGKGIGVYVKGFNLLNSGNARWEGYDALGISVMGGVRVRF